jgi:hypothetical protein
LRATSLGSTRNRLGSDVTSDATAPRLLGPLWVISEVDLFNPEVRFVSRKPTLTDTTAQKAKGREDRNHVSVSVLATEGHSESSANLLIHIGSNSAGYSEYALISLKVLPDFDSTMRRFESSRPSQAVVRSAWLPKRLENRPEIRAFRVFDSVSVPSVQRSQDGNRRKSPALCGNIPVLQRLSAETGFDHDCRPRR